MRVPAVMAAAVVLLGGATGCSRSDGKPAAAPSPTPTAVAVPPWTPSDKDVQAVCDGRAQPAAPARAAAPPRPIRVVEGRRAAWSPTTYYFGEFNDLKDVQLVGCLSLASTAPKRLKWCDYLGYKYYGMHPGIYRMTVREARTARVLSDRTFTGSDADCPKVLYAEPPQKRLITRPDTAQITALLEPAIRR